MVSTIQFLGVTEWLNEVFSSLFGGNAWLATILISMIPMIELKGGIVFGRNPDFWGENALGGWQALVCGLAGGLIVILVLTFLLQPVFAWLKRTKLFRRFVLRLEKSFRKKAGRIDALSAQPPQDVHRASSAAAVTGEAATAARSICVGQAKGTGTGAETGETAAAETNTGEAATAAANAESREATIAALGMAASQAAQAMPTGQGAAQAVPFILTGTDAEKPPAHEGQKEPCERAGVLAAQGEEVRRARKKTFGKMLGVFLFVAVPMPLTGVWTGTAIAVFLGLKKWQTILSAFVGNAVAGIIILFVSEVFFNYLDIVFYVILGIVLLLVLIGVGKMFIDSRREKREEEGNANGKE